MLAVLSLKTFSYLAQRPYVTSGGPGKSQAHQGYGLGSYFRYGHSEGRTDCGPQVLCSSPGLPVLLASGGPHVKSAMVAHACHSGTQEAKAGL